MKKNLIVFGTRPEAIKMAPLILEWRKSSRFETRVCVTGQHREMLDQVLYFFNIVPDYDLNLMRKNQNLFSLTADIVLGLKTVLEDFGPDFVYVHGDTTTTLAASIAAYYSGAKVCHVEAGLRTNNKLSPFPEEINRQLVSRIADYHFAPTMKSKENLLIENIIEGMVVVTGNTVIDALYKGSELIENWINDEISYLESRIIPSRKVVLVTLHRRENYGIGFVNVCEALLEIVKLHDDVQIVFPVHLNPNVREIVHENLSNIESIILIEPLGYPAFIWLMNRSYLILTDSGGVQEEAPSLGKPVLVLRDNTERPEAVSAGTVILVGTNKDLILGECTDLLTNPLKYRQMSELHNPYGDGSASTRIVDFISSLPN